MIPKPPSCIGCPYYNRTPYWVPDELVEGAPVMVVGQRPHKAEEAEGRPFAGKTGTMMSKAFLPLAGLQRGGVSIGNAIRCRVNEGTEMPPIESREMRDAIKHCTDAHLRVPDAVKVIVAQGEHALYAITGEGLTDYKGGISDWRGWVLPFNPYGRDYRGFTPATDIWTPRRTDLKVLATYHLAYLFRDPAGRVAAQRDWSKVPLILKGTWPEPLPPIQTSPPPNALTGWWSFDSEWDMDTGNLTCYSLAQDRDLYVLRPDDLLLTTWPEEPIGIIGHNILVDLVHWEALTGLVEDNYGIEDTMYAHAALWPGSQDTEGEKRKGIAHDLGFCGSLYARINRWKHLADANRLVYSGGDAIGTWDVWQALKGELQRDPGSKATYYERKLPCLPIIRRAQTEGMRVDQAVARESLGALQGSMRRAEVRAQAVVGFPINLGSQQQVAYQLWDVEKVGEAKRPQRRRKQML